MLVAPLAAQPPGPPPGQPPGHVPGAVPAAPLRRFRAWSGLTFAFAWVPVMYTHFTAVRGFTPDEYIGLWSLYYLSMVAFELPWGWLADRIGRRPLLVAGPATLAAAFLALGRAESVDSCRLLMLVIGSGHAMISGADSAWLYEWLDRHGGAAGALREEAAAQRWRLGGVAVLDIAGGLVAFGFGTTAAFDLGALAMLCAALLAAGLPRVAPLALTLPHTAFVRVAATLRAPGVLWALTFYAAVFVALRVGFQLIQPTLLALGAEDLRLHGLIFGGLSLVAAAAMPFVSRCHERFGERGAAVFTLALLALSFAGLSQVAAGPAVLLLFALQQVSFAFLVPIGRTALNRRIGEGDRAATLSAQSLLARLGFGLLLALPGWDRVLSEDLGDSYLALAVASVVALLALAATHREQHARSGTESA